MRIKKNRYEQAILELEKRKEELAKEEASLLEKEKARDEVLRHKGEKLQQLRRELDEGTTTDKITQMKNYLTVVEENLAEEEKKVDRQKTVVTQKTEEVAKAKELVLFREKDLEKLREHKKIWTIEEKYQMGQQEAKEQDELGSSAHTLKKIAKRKRSQ